ncbi:MAG: DMT family transporter [bacterium]
MKNYVNLKSSKGIFFLVLSAFLYSLMPVAMRILGRGGLSPFSQVFLRYIVAFLCAFIYFFIIKKAKVKLRMSDIGFMLGTSIVGYALANLALTYAVLNTQVSNALFLFYTYAIIAPLFGFLLLKERMNKYNLLSLLFIFVALFLLFQPNGIASWKIGGLFAILSAFGQSIYLIGRKKLHSYSAGFMMILNTSVGVLILGILSLILDNSFYFKGGLQEVSLQTWIVTILFGIDNFLAYFTMTKGFEYFKATTGSLILLSGLVFGVVFAFLFFAEIPTLITIIGGILILLSISTVILKGAS